jgi:ribosome-associated protein
MTGHSHDKAASAVPDTHRIVIGLAELLRDKKARDILVLDLADLTSITDYFVIATVNSSTQSKALVRFIEEYLDRYEITPLTRNDEYDSPWVLLDYNFFIIHLFLREGREYYKLEKLWSDAQVVFADEGGAL